MKDTGSLATRSRWVILKPARFLIYFVYRSLVASLPLILGTLPALAQSPWLITNSSPYSLGARATNLQGEYYRVEQWGFLFTRTTLWHDVWYYPTPNERHEASVFFIEAHNAASGDFNGDGKKDLMVNWAVFPHTVVRPLIAPSVLLNNGSGGLTLSPSSWVNGTGPARLFSYRTGAADFNHDGTDDFVAATGGIHTTHATGAVTQIFEPIPLALSTGDGRLFDATTLIAGQENGGVEPELRSAHNLAIGDLNGDGHKDFFQGNFLFLNDGTGRFAVRQDLLPPEASSLAKRVMSSASADFDNDGVDDLAIAYFDGQPSAGGSGFIFLSSGTGGIVKGRKVLLPAGRFGLQTTKHNFMTICDLNRDGLKDIVIAQTRTNPYYAGRTLQVLMNKGNGQFVDESAQRIVGNDDRHESSRR